MTSWLERARREIQNSPGQGTANTAERTLTAVTAVPHPGESRNSRVSNGSNGSTLTKGSPEIEGGIQPQGEIPKTSSQPTAVTAERRLPPLSPASEARRQKALALLARDGRQYAALVEDPNADPVILALATPAGTCELLISKRRYDPFAIVAMVVGWNREEP